MEKTSTTRVILLNKYLSNDIFWRVFRENVYFKPSDNRLYR